MAPKLFGGGESTEKLRLLFAAAPAPTDCPEGCRAVSDLPSAFAIGDGEGIGGFVIGGSEHSVIA